MDLTLSSHQDIPSGFSYFSHYADVLGTQMHYIDEGEGEIILFIHGMSTSSFLWRNILPHTIPHARCIAVDLIGMGKSGKPDIDYSIQDHIRYLTAFIDALNLDNITLVMHGSGTIMGLHYAMAQQQKIRAIAFMEPYLYHKPNWQASSFPFQDVMQTIKATPDKGYDLIMNQNYFIDYILPKCILRQLNNTEMSIYRAPFLLSKDRKPLFQFVQEVLLQNNHSDTQSLIQNYTDQLIQSSLPKLMLYAIPGFTVPVAMLKWCQEHLTHLSVIDVGDALHYAQEDNPVVYAEGLLHWFKQLEHVNTHYQSA